MAAVAQSGATRFLDPAVLASIGSLELKARVIVEGFLQGLHRSPFRGFSVEFAEYGPYLPGDDPATIDWKVYARSDRYYVKRFEHETNLPCHLLVDLSASMAYSSGTVTKLAYATWMAAALAYMLNRQRDAVGLMAFDRDITVHLPPSTRSGHLRALLATLERLTPGAASDLSRPLSRLAEALTRRGLIMVMSDLLDEPQRVISGLKYLRSRGMEVVVFHLLDPAELSFPFERSARFQDLETGEERLVTPSVAREEYLQKIVELCELYERELRIAGVDYSRIETSTPLDAALLSYLAARRRVIA